MIIKTVERFLILLKFHRIKFLIEGKGCKYRYLNSVFNSAGQISLGNNVHLGPGTELHGEGDIEIGNGVIFAPEVCVYSRTHHFDSEDLGALPYDNRILVSKVTIGDYVWVGRRVIILPGVSIGKASIIGAGAVVSKDVPDYAVVAGNPAKIVRYRNKDIINKLLSEPDPFVYNRYGHKKILIRRSEIRNAAPDE